MLDIPFLPDMNIVLIAFLFSAAGGMIFGYFPALKAARLYPIDALRQEEPLVRALLCRRSE